MINYLKLMATRIIHYLRTARRLIIVLFNLLLGIECAGQPVIQWAGIVESQNWDQTKQAVLDKAGNLFYTGFTQGLADFDPGPDTSFMPCYSFLSKLNAAGSLVWAKSMGAAAITQALAIDNASNIYLTGVFCGLTDFDPGPSSTTLTVNQTSFCTNYDVFVTKFDSAGNFKWVRIFKETDSANQCGYSTGYKIVSGLNNRIHIVGCFIDTLDVDPGPAEYKLVSATRSVFVVTLDSAGNLMWAKQFGTAGFFEDYSLLIDSVGSIYIAGQFLGQGDFDPGPGLTQLTAQGEDDILIMKLAVSGELQWCHQLGGGAWDYVEDMTIANGSLFLTGYYRDTLYWDNVLMANEPVATESSDILIARLSCSDGSPQWIEGIGRINDDVGYAITAYPPSSLFLACYLGWDSVDVDPKASTYFMSDLGTALLEFDQSGAFICAGKVSKTGGVVAVTDIEYKGNDEFFVVGTFSGTVDLDPGPGTYTLATLGPDVDILLAQYSVCGSNTFIEQELRNSFLSVYPNPNNGRIYAKTDTEFDRLEIYNVLSERVRGLDKFREGYIDLSDQPSGLYFLLAKRGSASFIYKICKE
jgi:hypothetical protein